MAYPESVSHEYRIGVVLRRELTFTWIGRTSPILVGRLRGNPVVSVGTAWAPALGIPYDVTEKAAESHVRASGREGVLLSAYPSG